MNNLVAVACEDAWMETCLIDIAAQAGSDVKFHGLIALDGMEFNFGEKDTEGVPLVNGGRVTKWTPEGDTEITFKAYAIQAGTDTGTTGLGFFDLLHAQDTSVPIRITNTRARTKYRLLFMWTNDPTPTQAKNITNANYWAKRFGFADGHFTKVSESFSDGILETSLTYKCSAYDKAGASCVMQESCAGASGSDILPAVAAYTSSNKFG